jgi:hypothetical protein
VGIPTEFLPREFMVRNQAGNQRPALKDRKLEGILPALGDRTIRFISESLQKKEPFLVYMPLTSSHTPLAVNSEWKAKIGLNLFADFVTESDAVVGRLLDAPEKSGAADTKLVIFTAENSCAPYIGVEELEKLGPTRIVGTNVERAKSTKSISDERGRWSMVMTPLSGSRAEGAPPKFSNRAPSSSLIGAIVRQLVSATALPSPPRKSLTSVPD